MAGHVDTMMFAGVAVRTRAHTVGDRTALDTRGFEAKQARMRASSQGTATNVAWTSVETAIRKRPRYFTAFSGLWTSGFCAKWIL